MFFYIYTHTQIYTHIYFIHTYTPNPTYPIGPLNFTQKFFTIQDIIVFKKLFP